MRNFFLLLPLLALGCVDSNTAVAYAQRAHPECTGHRSLSHSYSSGSETKRGSQTEVSMTCNGKQKSITVKCIHGFDIIDDTVCHENN